MSGIDTKYGKIFTENDVQAILNHLAETGALSVPTSDLQLENVLGSIDREYTFDGQLVFCLVSGDQVAAKAIASYADLCRAAGVDEQHIHAARQAAGDFAAWQINHADEVKLPD